MIRLIVLSTAFVGATAALLWVLGDLPPEDPTRVDQVSRAEPAPMGFDAFVPAPAVAQPAPAPSRPLLAPTRTPEPSGQRPVARPAPEAAAPVSRMFARPAPAADNPDDVMKALERMSYGVMGVPGPSAQSDAGQTDSRAAAPRDTAVATATIAPKPAPAPSIDAGRTYTVQQGDSLPGIAFRFFGTTVAYLQILDANRDILPGPAQLRPGMVLRIPEGN